MPTITGGCFCGKIRYEADDAPMASMLCHCQSCRRIAGAPIVPWVTFVKAGFRFTRGVPALFDSSVRARRSFCTACGTPLTYESVKFADEIDVTTCSLDSAEAFPPTHHSWVSHDLAWLEGQQDLPKYPESRT